MIFHSREGLLRNLVLFSFFSCSIALHQPIASTRSDSLMIRTRRITLDHLFGSHLPHHFIWLGRLIILAPWSIVFGIFLVIFPFILIIFRPLPENDPFQRAILKVGNGVLKLNTKLLLALGLHTKPIRFSA